MLLHSTKYVNIEVFLNIPLLYRLNFLIPHQCLSELFPATKLWHDPRVKCYLDHRQWGNCFQPVLETYLFHRDTQDC